MPAPARTVPPLMRRHQLFAPHASTLPPMAYANRSRWFQAMLDAACDRYAVQRRAFIHPVPVAIDMDRGQARKRTTDYTGFLPTRPRPRVTVPDPADPEARRPVEDKLLAPIGVAFDTKSTAGYEWGSGIPDHQLEILALVSELGHRAGILVGFAGQRGAPPVAIWIPWSTAKQLAHGKWSQPKLLQLPGTHTVMWTGFLDFLPVLLNG